jgi:hypothetical protein
LYKSGYYRLDVSVVGSNDDKPVISKRVIKMVAGATDPKSTELSMPVFYNRGNAP